MKYILLICFCFLSFIGSSQEILDFPDYSYKIKYVGCEEYLTKTPKKINPDIIGDTLIHLNQFDDRLNVSLKFNWDNETDNLHQSIGVLSIEVLQNNLVIQFIDMNTITEDYVYYNKGRNEGRKGEYSRNDIVLMDFNFDTYLDLYLKDGGGYTYLLYNKEKHIFETKKNLFSKNKLININCERKLIFTYDGGTSSAFYNSSAYKVKNGEISLYQKYRFESSKDYTVKQYKNEKGKILKEIRK